MFYVFETKKALEAAGVLLRAHRGRMSRRRLLTLLYVADRESFRTTGWPIVGNHPVAADQGPQHSEVQDLLNGEFPGSESWLRSIDRHGYELMLRPEHDPGVLSLSKHELHVLNQVAEQFRDFDDWSVVAHTHTFPEWIENHRPGATQPIAVADILRAVGFVAEDTATILQHVDEAIATERASIRAHPANVA